MLLTNGRIYTMDDAASVVDTLVVREGRIAFVGRRLEANVSDREPVIDLEGRAVLPGLVDGHAHLLMLARRRLGLDLSDAGSEAEVAARVASAAARARAGAWITGQAWDETRWPGRTRPNRRSLDRVAPNHPVALVRVDGHATWANSAALRRGGIDRGTRDPDGGVIVRDGHGEPTGLLIDAAQRFLAHAQPPPGDDELDAAVRVGIDECLRAGLTGVHEMGVDVGGFACYTRLVERGQFPFRTYAAVRASSSEFWEYARDRGPWSIGDGRVVAGAVKLMVDGALGSRGALLHEPYCDDPGTRGLMLLPPDELERLTAEAMARGFQVCVHAIGDRANTLTLDALEAVLAREGRGADHRFRIEHAQILAEEDVPRFAQLGVVPSMQATHCTSDMRWAEERLGPDRLRGAYAWRSLLATGVVIAGGSDFPVESPNPFHGIFASVARRALAGEAPAWQPEQRMTRDEAVRSYTTWNAYASRQEADLGTLLPGERADLVVLSDDVFACPEARIKEIVPVLTMVGGEIVYERPAPT